MKIIQGTTDFELEASSAVAIGKFDGIHIGHQKLLNEVLSAREEGLQAVVFTFDPPAASFFAREKQKELTTREEKRIIFEKMGVDTLVEYPLNEKTAAILPESFIREILVKRLLMVRIAAGTDLSYGFQGKGDCGLLQDMAEAGGYRVCIVEKETCRGREVSSTFVREEVAAGNMEAVTELLGYHYSVSGPVLRGNRFGRTIQMPTVNLCPGEGKLLPPNGVYYANVLYGGRRLKGMTNIGFKPTVSEKLVLGVETYIYDFRENLYGKYISVELLSYRRAEQKFADVEALKRQMYADREDGRVYFGEVY